MFKTYGIKSVTMDTLASHLGISKRTIYEIFSDKDELLVGVLKWMTEKQNELVKRILSESENAIVAIFKMLEISRDHFQNLSPAFQADMKKYHYDVMMKKAEKKEMPDYRNNQLIIEKGIKEKLFREDIDPDLANRCLYNMGRSVMDNDLYPFDLFSRRDVIKNIFINYLRGISTPEGLVLIGELEQKI